MQELAWNITVVSVSALLLVFLLIAFNGASRIEYKSVQNKAGCIRTFFFWGLLIVIVPTIGYSLTQLPYPDFVSEKENAKAVTVIGRQWSWDISDPTAVVGEPVAYHVQSMDVNHGFALYDPALRIVAQTQAMPGYTNILYHTFTEPGVYKVLCLEYCGLAHHAMIGEITVIEKNEP